MFQLKKKNSFLFLYLQTLLLSSFAKDVSGFSVSDPVKGGHTTYTVRGHDDDGPFEGSRRYNDFFTVRDHLVKNWPGVYVPPIPPKKMTGNKDD